MKWLTQIEVDFLLAFNSVMSVTDVAKLTKRHHSRIMRIKEKLVSLGFVVDYVSSKGVKLDNRTKLYELTDKGRNLQYVVKRAYGVWEDYK